VRQFLKDRQDRGSRVRVVLQCFSGLNTKDGIDAFRRAWGEYVDDRVSIYVRPVLNWGGRVGPLPEVLHQRRYPCVQLWGSLVADVDGNLYPCCECFASRTKSALGLGAVTDTLWHDAACAGLGRFRNLHLRDRYHELSDCANCDFWSFAPNTFARVGDRWF